MSELTPKQAKILAFIREYVAKNQMPPTREEIGKRFKFSRQAAQCHLDAIQKKGAIRLVPAIGRGIQVLASSQEMTVK